MAGPSDAELRAALEAALASVGLGLAGEVERRPSPYRTSFPIEELRVELAERGPVRLAFKQLDWEELEPAAQLAKPRFLHDPAREPAVYRTLLAGAPAGPPEFFGAVGDGGQRWLFVEWVEGRELFQVGERELWEEAARWLARFHVALAPDLDRCRGEARLSGSPPSTSRWSRPCWRCRGPCSTASSTLRTCSSASLHPILSPPRWGRTPMRGWRRSTGSWRQPVPA
jgi:hypothetical protein